MKDIKQLGLMIASTAAAASLLAVYFDWRARFLGGIRGAVDRFEDGAVNFWK